MLHRVLRRPRRGVSQKCSTAWQHSQMPPPKTQAELDALTAEYRKSRGWGPAGTTSRVSLELPVELVTKLNKHCRINKLRRHEFVAQIIEAHLPE